MGLMQALAKSVLDEIEHAVETHGALNSHHEAYGVLMEEVDEYFQEVKKRDANCDLPAMRAELIQIAAVALRAAYELT